MTVKHLFPAAKPTVNFDFANSLVLDPRIDFSRASTGTYVNADGVVRTALENEPRFEYDYETGKCLGLLIEESRINYFENSVFTTSRDWQASNKGTLTANQAIAPDGTMTAAALTPTSTETVGVTKGFADNADPYTLSCFIKPVNADVWTIGAKAWNSYGNGEYTFSTKSWGGSGLSNFEDYGVDELANGWFRLWVCFNATASGGNSIDIDTIDGSDGVLSGYMWGVQLEAGDSFCTSYIPTSGPIGPGVCNCRAIDQCSISGDNFTQWFNQSEGTFFVSVAARGRLKAMACSTGPAVYQDTTYNFASNGENDAFYRIRFEDRSQIQFNLITFDLILFDAIWCVSMRFDAVWYVLG